jgi:hypothetical protein
VASSRCRDADKTPKNDEFSEGNDHGVSVAFTKAFFVDSSLSEVVAANSSRSAIGGWLSV